jgi:uncharacterized protein (DUF342 family)
MKCQSCNAIVEKEGRCQECGSIVVDLPPIGKLALKYKTVTNSQLSESIKILDRLKKKIPIQQIWVQKKFATSEQIDLLLIIKEFIDLQDQDKAFLQIALNKGFVNKENVETAKKKQYNYFRKLKTIRLVGEILVDDKTISIENCNTILSAQKRELITEKREKPEVKTLSDFEKAFLGIRKKDEQFAKIAMKTSAASKKDIVLAFKKQVNEFKSNNKIKLVGEILYDQGAIEYNQVELILKEQGRDDVITGLRQKYLKRVTKKEDNVKPKSKKSKKADLSKIELVVSDDNLKAYFRYGGKSDEKPVLNDIKKLLIEKQVKFGVVKKSLIMDFLNGDNLNKDFLIAEGKAGFAGYPAKIEYLFDTEFFNSEVDKKAKETIQVKRGTVLARKTPMNSIKKGIDIFGNPVDPLDNRLRCGYGTKLSKDCLEIVATKTGEARLSIDQKVYVLTKTNLLEDADVRTGPFECCNFNISGIVTDAFPISGGDLKAEEIRGGKLDMIGDIVVDIGIIGAKIKTQGSIKAKYIHNSQIEAFGDVITNNEILDSNVLSSGVCKSKNSKIVASSISAKKGIYSKGIGTESSIPCMLNAGVDDHVVNEVKEIDIQVKGIKEKLRNLEIAKNKLAHKDKKLKKDIGEKRKFIKQIDLLFKKVDLNIKKYQEEKDKTALKAELIKKNKLEVNYGKAKRSLDSITEVYRELSEKFKKASYEHLTYLRGSENELVDLLDKKRAYLLWSEKTPNKKALRIEGDLISGTTVSGPNTTVTTVDGYKNIKILELQNSKDPSKWQLKIDRDGDLVNLY